jgi:hypothetical protein
MNSSARQTARFRFGWAWGSPEMQPDGLRGVGVTELAKRTTRVVGVAVPPRVVSQMREVSARRPMPWLVGRLMARKLRDERPTEYRWEQGEGWYHGRPGGKWNSIASVPDPAAPIEQLMIGVIAIPGGRSDWTGEPMWRVVEVTEVGCAYDAPDLWAEWRQVSPHK